MTASRESRWPQGGAHKRTTFGGLTRSQLMSRIRSHGNKTTELKMAEILRQNRVSGWRRNYPILGSPDFVWPKKKVALFVDGCFWHGHDCRNLKPSGNARVWEKKILHNKRRDRKVSLRLRQDGWFVTRVWECDLKCRPQFIIRRIERLLTKRNN